MGIQGLLKALSPLILDEENGTKSNIRQFSNKSLAIDASSWLFKASYSCAERLVERSLEISGQPVDHQCEQIICRYFVSRCEELLRYASIRRIYLVFDGKRCPLKDVTSKDREERRRNNLEEARRLKAFGKNREADEKYRACLKVASWMSSSVTRAIEKQFGTVSKDGHSMPQVISVLSPAEADAQLAKLCLDGHCDAVVTEDSDILVYSAVTHAAFPIIYKFDRDNGSCDVITMDWLLTHFNKPSQSSSEEPFRRRYLDLPTDKSNKSASSNKRKPTNALTSALTDMVSREGKQRGHGVRMFVQACILSGCDYAPSRLNGIGLVNAFRLVQDFANRDADDRFSIILRSLPSAKISSAHSAEIRTIDGAVRDYEDRLARSEVAFYYHQVLDIKSRNTVSLSTYENEKHINPQWPSLKRFNFDLTFIGCDQPSYQRNEKHRSPLAKKSSGQYKNESANNSPHRSPQVKHTSSITKKSSGHTNESANNSPYRSPQVKQVRTVAIKSSDNRDTSLATKNESANNAPYRSPQVKQVRTVAIKSSDNRDTSLATKKDFRIASKNPFSNFSCITERMILEQVNESATNTINIVDDDNGLTPGSANSEIGDDEDCGIMDVEKSFIPSVMNRVESLRRTSIGFASSQSRKRVLSRVSESFDQVTHKKARTSSLLDLTNSPSRKQKPNNGPPLPSVVHGKKAVSTSSMKNTKSQIKTLSITSYFSYK